jgi:hypothetical protein
MEVTSKSLSLKEVAGLTVEELAEQFKAGDLELCIEPFSEWGSDVETFLQKLEKGLMQWYEVGGKRSLSLCFLETAPATQTSRAEETPTMTPAAVS